MVQGRAQNETDALQHVVGRLGGQFPELPADEIERTVHDKYESFADSPIRDFVPVLVERAARKQLSDQHTGHA